MLIVVYSPCWNDYSFCCALFILWYMAFPKPIGVFIWLWRFYFNNSYKLWNSIRRHFRNVCVFFISTIPLEEPLVLLCLIQKVKSLRLIPLFWNPFRQWEERRRHLRCFLLCDQWQSIFIWLIMNWLMQLYIISLFFIIFSSFDSLIVVLPNIRIGKEDNKVTNLIHLFCSHLADSCSADENAVCICFVFFIVLDICWLSWTRARSFLFSSCIIRSEGILCSFETCK